LHTIGSVGAFRCTGTVTHMEATNEPDWLTLAQMAEVLMHTW